MFLRYFGHAELKKRFVLHFLKNFTFLEDFKRTCWKHKHFAATAVYRYMRLYKLQNDLTQKSFKIQFCGPNSSNMACRSLKTPFQLFKSLRMNSQHENSLTLVGANIGFTQFCKLYVKDLNPSQIGYEVGGEANFRPDQSQWVFMFWMLPLVFEKLKRCFQTFHATGCNSSWDLNQTWQSDWLWVGGDAYCWIFRSDDHDRSGPLVST